VQTAKKPRSPGRLFAIDYGPVSQERKRLREKLERDRKLRALMNPNRKEFVIK
jgi:hypothetical protein